jgi:hypothetical protein
MREITNEDQRRLLQLGLDNVILRQRVGSDIADTVPTDPFREAIVRLHQHFRGTTTKLILPVHDAVVIECDSAEIDIVTRQAGQIMIAAVRKYYPAINPRVEANSSDHRCWNKDGHADSLEKFLEDPLYKLV